MSEIKAFSHLPEVSAQRRANMAAISSKNTKPEIAVRKILHGLGYRFRLHAPSLPGKPDIVLPGRKTIIFVHGCFWHRHPKCRFAYSPKTRVEFWENKFRNNVLRDKQVRKLLQKLGWDVQIVWECQTRDSDKLRKRLKRIRGLKR
jgi:DNA mismatch endonuclease (patch repair protein)